MASINEISEVSPSQYTNFFPKQHYNIPKATINRVKSTITSLNSGIVTKTFSQTASTPYDFVLGANSQSIIDLSACYFNVAGRIRIPGECDAAAKDLNLGNLFLGSLFQNAQLELGGSVIAMNANPGIDANMQAALKYDRRDLEEYTVSDREFMINYFDKDLDSVQQVVNIIAGAITFPALPNNLPGSIVNVTAGTTPAIGLANTRIVATQTVGLAVHANATVDAFDLTFGPDGVLLTGWCNVTTNAAINAPFQNLAIQTVVNPPNDISKVISQSYIAQAKDRCSVIPNCTPIQERLSDGNLYTTFPFRCKLFLSDLFNYTVDSLDYIFNREIKITLTRSASSHIICNITSFLANEQTKAEVYEMNKFELVCFSYLLTDKARSQLIQHYSSPVETLYGVQTTNLTPLYNFSSQTEQTITLPLTVNFDTKAIILAFPKCANPMVPLNSSTSKIITSSISAQDIAAGSKQRFQLSWYQSNANSYNFCGLRYIRIFNTSNSNIYTYDFQGTEETVSGTSPFLHSFDHSNSVNQCKILDYRDAYNQYKQLRMLFGKSIDNGLDYYEYLKDYCLIPIDLTGTNIPPNTRIMITMQFSDYGLANGGAVQGYSPTCFGNVLTPNDGNLLTTNLLAIFLGSDVLTYNPDGTCVVKHVLTAVPNEKNVNLV